MDYIDFVSIMHINHDNIIRSMLMNDSHVKLYLFLVYASIVYVCGKDLYILGEVPYPDHCVKWI